MKIRVGFGYDVHALVPDRELWLGGIKIEHTLGLLGHSDADVLIHAICDALLGAANMRDIGYHFPDTAGEYKNIDSKILLRDTMKLLREAGYELGNIDATVAAERPKLNPHIPLMKKTLAEVMNVDEGGYFYQGHHHGEAGLHRTAGRDLGLRYGVDTAHGIVNQKYSLFLLPTLRRSSREDYLGSFGKWIARVRFLG